ncbi:MAG: hypothetical protein CM1200mP26_06650 [Acidimicrobiales bacterium]|nr:MAG: hypothetical protein CM1200mP26_06650 [Acidimicrobiales bacterium]
MKNLTPPVANKQIWRDADMIVMIVGGGNQRNDFQTTRARSSSTNSGVTWTL